jgi:signal transduction histidine kinase
MRLLPTLFLGSRTLALPLAESTARQLLAALVSADAGSPAEAVAEHLSATLEADPALLLWAAILAHGRGVSGLTAGRQLAGWLAGVLAEVLVWPNEPGAFAAQAPSVTDAAECAAQVSQWASHARLEPQSAELVRRAVARLQADCPGDADRAVSPTWAESDGALLAAVAGRLARLRALEQQFAARLEIEKLDALKELAYGAGHEINNPLANISARAQTLLEDETDPERRRKLAAINTQAFRAHEMIADMMLFARPPKPKLERLDLARLVAQLIAELAPAAADQCTELLLHATADAGRLLVDGDKTQLSVAVRALVVNALEALVTGGRVEISIRAATVAPANSLASDETVQIAVSDNGPGITEQTRRHIFDPFYSGREAGRGLGFGLSKCWRIAGLHGGAVDVASTPGAGATFTLTLPIRPIAG